MPTNLTKRSTSQNNDDKRSNATISGDGRDILLVAQESEKNAAIYILGEEGDYIGCGSIGGASPINQVKR